MTTRQDRRKDQVFVQSSFRARNKYTGSDKSKAFILRMNSEEHRSTAEKYALYKTMNASGKTVVDLLDSEHKKQVRVTLRRYKFVYLITGHLTLPMLLFIYT